MLRGRYGTVAAAKGKTTSLCWVMPYVLLQSGPASHESVANFLQPLLRWLACKEPAMSA
jgi:hypothetical protein